MTSWPAALAVTGVLLVCTLGCAGSSAKPNVAVHMTPGSTASECMQIARYNVESGQRQFAGKGGNYVPGHHELEVQLAVIKAAADQLPDDDPVHLGALRYVSHGTSYPYFQPCRRVMDLADEGRLPTPSP